jgi:hypothetical protein
VQETDPAAASSGVAVGHTDISPEEDHSTAVAITPEGPTPTVDSSSSAQEYPQQNGGTLGQQPLQPARSDQADSPSASMETEATVETNRPLSEEEAVIAAVAACGCSVWLRMSRWARLNEVLEPRERSLVYNVGRRLREGMLPTIRQLRWAQAILAKAVQLGFDPTATE